MTFAPTARLEALVRSSASPSAPMPFATHFARGMYIYMACDVSAAPSAKSPLCTLEVSRNCSDPQERLRNSPFRFDSLIRRPPLPYCRKQRAQECWRQKVYDASMHPCWILRAHGRSYQACRFDRLLLVYPYRLQLHPSPFLPQSRRSCFAPSGLQMELAEAVRPLTLRPA